MSATNLGMIHWSLSRDGDGHRTYKAQYKVRTTSASDGPSVVLNCPGLPRPGTAWSVGNDSDPSAFCLHNAAVNPMYDGERILHWTVELTFSTKPSSWCQDTLQEYPLLQPAEVSGTFTKDKEEATVDRFRRPITNSAWEQIRGPVVEFDVSRPTVTISQNVATFTQAAVLPYIMRDCVNQLPLWGFGRRCIKLSNVSWERKYYGQCYQYYNRKLEFEIHADSLSVQDAQKHVSGWDRDILDEGTKVLNGRWNRVTGVWELLNIDGQAPNPSNPEHFIRFKDKNGENTNVILNGAGLPAGAISTVTPRYIADFTYTLGGQQSITGRSLKDTRFWRPYPDPIPPTTLESMIDGAGNLAIANRIVKGHYYYYTEPTSGNAGLFRALDNQEGARGFGNNFEGARPPQFNAGFPTTSVLWSPLGGANSSPITIQITEVRDMGPYDAAGVYQLGMVAIDTTAISAGYIHVERYPEANFLLLGIPTQL